MCYAFLFKGLKPLTVYGRTMELLAPKNASSSPIPEPLAPDITNSTVTSLICSTLDHAECERWRTCSSAAFECCRRQMGMAKSTAAEDRPSGGGTRGGSLPMGEEGVDGEGGLGGRGGVCMRTWDGYSCWEDTPAGVTATTSCPSYVSLLISDRRAIKQCTVNGTWFQKAGYEWTDYTPCLNKEGYVVGVYIRLGCSITSLVLLLPAIAIFLSFRDLRNQQRIRLHVHFFLSLVLAGLANILWFLLVHYDLLVAHSQTQTVVYENPVWCRLLSFMKIYLTATNYFWMFGEGYFLHRLISNAFEPPESLAPVYVLGWAAPSVPAIIYAIARAVVANDRCWAISLPGYQWIIYVPNFICLFANLLFLCNILRILLFQLHAHPHEPSNFRRGLKAAFMLIPLFGLHTFVTIYRLPPGHKGEKEWEYVTILISYLQGAFVALIYCFFNGEVLSHFKKLCPMLRRQKAKLATPNFTQVTICDGRSPTGSFRSRGSPKNATNSPQNGTLLSNGGRKGAGYELCDMAASVIHDDSDRGRDEEGAQSKMAADDKDTGGSPQSGKGYCPVPTVVMTEA